MNNPYVALHRVTLLLLSFGIFITACDDNEVEEPPPVVNKPANFVSCEQTSECVGVINPCDGEPLCFKPSIFSTTGFCMPMPETQVVCPQVGGVCQLNTCDPESGQCVMRDLAPYLGSTPCSRHAQCSNLVPGAQCDQGICVMPCDDGQSCSSNDRCIDGSICQGLPPSQLEGLLELHSDSAMSSLGTDGLRETFDFNCGCNTHSDCDFLKTLCGEFYCDEVTNTCLLDTKTFVYCPEVSNCVHNSCDLQTGECSQTAKPTNNGYCENDLYCTEGYGLKNATCIDNQCRFACEADNSFCTVDYCQDGACFNTPWTPDDTSVCECITNIDCEEQFGNNNLCDGTLYCDSSKKCQLNPTSVVTCPAVTNSPCQENTCDPLTGQCSIQHVPLIPIPDAGQCTTDSECDLYRCTAGNYVLDDQWSAATCTYGKSEAYIPGECVQGTCHTKKLCPLYDSAWSNQCREFYCDEGECIEKSIDYSPNDHGWSVCQCSAHEDCEQKLGNNNLCQSYYCDLMQKTCHINPASVVTCPEIDDACSTNQCDPLTGQCSIQPKPLQPPEEGAPSCQLDSQCDVVYCVDSWKSECPQADQTPNLVMPGACVQGACTKPLPCQDNNLCTIDDHCELGQCVSSNWDIQHITDGWPTCACQTDQDCETMYGDGDLCNGTMFCNLAANACQLNPASVVTCPPITDSCKANLCNPNTGECSVQPLPPPPAEQNAPNCVSDQDCAQVYCSAEEGWVFAANCNSSSPVPPVNGSCVEGLCRGVRTCSDDHPCTVDDHCSNGQCTSTPWNVNQQPAGWPTPCQCWNSSDCEPNFGDGNMCNGTLSCFNSFDQSGGLIKSCEVNPATVVQCALYGGGCSEQICQPETGECLSVNIPSPISANPPNRECESSADCEMTPCYISSLWAYEENCPEGDPTVDWEPQPIGECVNGWCQRPSMCNDQDQNTAATRCINGQCLGTLWLGEPSACHDVVLSDNQPPVFEAHNEGLACQSGLECVQSATCTSGLCVPSGSDCLSDDDYEDNDTLAQAHSLGSRINVLNHLVLSDDDYFSIYVCLGGTLNVVTRFAHTNGDIDIELFNPFGGLVTQSNSINNFEEVTMNANESGEWVVRVFAYDQRSTVYSIKVEINGCIYESIVE